MKRILPAVFAMLLVMTSVLFAEGTPPTFNEQFRSELDNTKSRMEGCQNTTKEKLSKTAKYEDFKNKMLECLFPKPSTSKKSNISQ